MAAPLESTDKAVVRSAEEVGNAFARQYYYLLEWSPSLVYLFYEDTSVSIMDSTAIEAINEKIKPYASLKADIKSVQAEYSHKGGVMVLVSGFMVDKDNSRRGFMQTFFLAPQGKDYYVCNSIFKYVENDIDVNEKQDCGTSHVSSNEEKVRAASRSILVSSNEEKYVSSNEEKDTPVASRSIHVKNLPKYVHHSEVERVFQRFGPIRSDGVQIRHSIDKLCCFGFVEFETVAAAKRAIEASVIEIDGRRVVIEEKRSTINRVCRKSRKR